MLAELRRRLARVYLLGLGIVLLGYSAAAFGLVRYTILWGLDEANRHLAMPLVTAVGSPGGSIADARRTLAAQPLAADERLELLAANGRPIAARGPGLAAMPLVPGVAVWQGEEAFRVFTVRVDAGGAGVVYVRAAHAATRPHQALITLAVVLAITLPLALLLAWALADRLAAHATAPVEAALDRERHFMRDVSHELRTPLAALQGQLALAVMAEPGVETRAKVAQAEALARRMGALVSDLLALSREDAGVAPSTERFDLEDLVEEEVALVRGLARARGVAIEMTAPPAEPETVGDPERIARAVRNLLENAVRYAPAGGRVAIGLEREAAQLRVRVCNDGSPIPLAERERLFERFFRGAHGLAARPEGTGLGLAIARDVARAHGGDLVLASGPDGPPCFVLSLPVVPGPTKL